MQAAGAGRQCRRARRRAAGRQRPRQAVRGTAAACGIAGTGGDPGRNGGRIRMNETSGQVVERSEAVFQQVKMTCRQRKVHLQAEDPVRPPGRQVQKRPSGGRQRAGRKFQVSRRCRQAERAGRKAVCA